MIKQFILLLNFIGLFLVHWFAGTVTMDETAPASAKAGSEFTVQVKISKGSIGGFARFQDELPEGFTATPIETKGADFRFEAQKVKFIWTSLPADADFEVSYKVTVANTASGDKTISSKFSYIEDSQSQSKTSSRVIHIEADPNASPLAGGGTGNSTGTGTGNTTETGTGNTTGTGTITTPPDTTAKPAVVVNCLRVVPTDAVQNEFQVDLHIKKGSITGFAKIEDELPNGFTASAVATGTTDFKFEKNKVKFIWVSLPAGDKEIVLSYKVTLDPGVNGQQVIKGLFSYIEGETPKQFIVDGSFINVKGTGSPIASGGTNPPDTANQRNTGTVNTTTANNNPTGGNGTTTTGTGVTGNGTSGISNTTPIADGTTGSGTTNTGGGTTGGGSNTATAGNNTGGNTATDPTTVPAPQNGVNFKVQIMALHRTIDNSYFVSNYKISEPIDHDMHEGWTKYIVAVKGYPNYKEARDYREVMRSKGVVAPFVTAYNSGKRITVQEALMINHQTWVR
jgi:hypothetical protein